MDAGTIELHTGFGIASLESSDTHVTVAAVDGRALAVDMVIPCTGFRSGLDMLRELRLNSIP